LGRASREPLAFFYPLLSHWAGAAARVLRQSTDLQSSLLGNAMRDEAAGIRGFPSPCGASQIDNTFRPTCRAYDQAIAEHFEARTVLAGLAIAYLNSNRTRC
jgi:hypothetical protein